MPKSTSNTKSPVSWWVGWRARARSRSVALTDLSHRTAREKCVSSRRPLSLSPSLDPSGGRTSTAGAGSRESEKRSSPYLRFTCQLLLVVDVWLDLFLMNCDARESLCQPHAAIPSAQPSSCCLTHDHVSIWWYLVTSCQRIHCRRVAEFAWLASSSSRHGFCKDAQGRFPNHSSLPCQALPTLPPESHFVCHSLNSHRDAHRVFFFKSLENQESMGGSHFTFQSPATQLPLQHKMGHLTRDTQNIIDGVTRVGSCQFKPQPDILPLAAAAFLARRTTVNCRQRRVPRAMLLEVPLGALFGQPYDRHTTSLLVIGSGCHVGRAHPTASGAMGSSVRLLSTVPSVGVTAASPASCRPCCRDPAASAAAHSRHSARL